MLGVDGMRPAREIGRVGGAALRSAALSPGLAFCGQSGHMPIRESGGRSRRQPGQVRKEAAATILPRVARLLLSVSFTHGAAFAARQ